MLNVTVAGSSAVQQSNNSITAGLISNHPNELLSLEQAMASTSFFSPKVPVQNQSFGKPATLFHQATIVLARLSLRRARYVAKIRLTESFDN